METAAYRVIEDIHYYNKLGGIKKELSDVNTKVFVMNQISARQNNAVMTVTKLQSREVTEDQILYLSKYLGEKTPRRLQQCLKSFSLPQTEIGQSQICK
jgi:hypothetical protein